MNQTDDLNRPQPPPAAGTGPAIWDILVIADGNFDADLVAVMRERDAVGAAKYGTRLYANNGRDMLTDAFQEALDLLVYLRGDLAQRDLPTIAFADDAVRLYRSVVHIVSSLYTLIKERRQSPTGQKST